MSGRLVVGFDLDMTLLDTRPGIKLVWEALSASTGIVVDSDLAISRLGPPLAAEMAQWVAPELVTEYVERYRSLYPSLAVGSATLLPGARESLEVVKAAGGQTLVVTAKNDGHARLHLDALDLPVDFLAGDLWAAEKGVALREHGADVYVGDHVHDMAGARAAAVTAVGVTTGPCTAWQLRDAGADAVLGSLADFPDWFAEHLLGLRLAELTIRLQELGSVMVAFSGGADSAFLLAAAVRAVGSNRVVAATAVSDSLPQAEQQAAAAFCAELGVRHLTPATHEMQRAGYRANGGDRCYFCKAELVEVLSRLAADLGFAAVVTGTNADDALVGFRPGIKAADERGAATPLLDVGLTKAQIRAASRQWGLPTWDKPAAACLSSRIAYGVEVTPRGLARVQQAELAVRTLLADRMPALGNVRVRDLGGGNARVEVDSGVLEELRTDSELAEGLLGHVVGAGFETAQIDDRGFRSGSMNELLADPARYR